MEYHLRAMYMHTSSETGTDEQLPQSFLSLTPTSLIVSLRGLTLKPVGT